jgi:hypothetical protein
MCSILLSRVPLGKVYVGGRQDRANGRHISRGHGHWIGSECINYGLRNRAPIVAGGGSEQNER